MCGKLRILPPHYNREAVFSQSHIESQCPLDVFYHSLQLPLIILVWSLYSRGEKLQCYLQILTYLSNSKKICATTGWNCVDYFSGRGLPSFSSRTLNKFSVADMGAVAVIYSGNLSNNFLCMASLIHLPAPWLSSQSSYPSSHDHIHVLTWVLVRYHQGILLLLW